MFGFIYNNLATIVISIVLTAIVTLIIVKKYKNKKSGASYCGCSCSGCPSADICHKK